jgi:hypothetical protein
MIVIADDVRRGDANLAIAAHRSCRSPLLEAPIVPVVVLGSQRWT